MDTTEILDNQSPAMRAAKKPPRKPRPSEIAAKLAKANGAKKSKAKTKAKAKPKAKRPTPKSKKPTKKTAKRKPAPKKKAKAAKRTPGVISRPERMDMRLTKAEKAKIVAVAKRTKRTITSVVYEAIAKIK